MLIISKFHDYYDTAMGYGGVDKSIVYNRKKKIIPNDIKSNNFFYFFNGIKYNNYFYYSRVENKIIKFIYILFCGEIFPLLVTEQNDKIYTVDQMDKYVNSTKEKKYIKKYFDKKNKYRNDIDKYFISNKSVVTKENLIDFHIHHKSPIIIFVNDYYNNNYKLILNPKLKTFHFYKIFNPFQAFQKIEQFISGVIGGEQKKIIEIEDKYRKTMHGFDEKSFRNM